MTRRGSSIVDPGLGRRRRAVLPMSVRRWGQPFALLAASSLLASPATSAARIEKFVPNVAPETIITGGPADSSAATPSRVHFFWTGADADGSVDHFDFIMVDHPRSKDSIGPGGTDPVIITVPLPDDPRWTSTTAMDSLFVASADTLRRNPRPAPGETAADVLRHPFERWHTFFIRAVDEAGTPDPTPDYRSFNAQTLAPTVHLLPPVQAGTNLIAPPVIVFHWDGKDPLNEHAFIRPVASRYVIIDSKLDISIPVLYASYPESLYTLPQRFQWSSWIPWDLPDGAGRQAVIKGLLRIGDAPNSGYYVFAVQALDEAGAITPVFDFQSNDLNNVALIRVQGIAGPVLVVREEVLGTQTFVGGSNPVRMQIAGGQTVAFRWSADASHYGGTITDYRYGWDILNPDNDQEWSPWSSSTEAPPRTFAAGTHRFLLQARDNTESRTGAIFELMVHAVTRNRDLLWVDDSDHLTDDVTESAEDIRWLSVYQQLTETSNVHFDPDLDVYDIRNNRDESPTLPLLLDYKVVVWSVRSGSSGSSGLRRTAQFFDPFPTRNQNSGRNFNILNVYVANGGKLWINGFRPAIQLWPDERAFGSQGQPVNVTHWDDPIEPHPGIDSVGSTSLLYEMGVEMFDVGATFGVPRQVSSHWCYGLQVATSGVPALQLHSSWGQGGTGGRSNIEIYDMPGALASQMAPLRPPPGKTRVLYTYVSHVPEDSSQHITYPVTADKQPMFLVTKAAPDDPYSNRALCGFEPYYLDSISHARLARHVLLEEMGLEPTPVFLRQLTAEASGGSVRIRWEVEASSDPAEFRLQASAGSAEWAVPFTSVGPREFAATDESPHLAGAGTVTYSLYSQEAGAPWVLLGQETVVLAAPPPVVQLLPPHPNPFNPRVLIPFVLPAKEHVRLAIYAPDGRRIALLLDAIRPAGPGSVSWDGTDALSRPVASGLYLARLDAGGASLSEKLLLLK